MNDWLNQKSRVIRYSGYVLMSAFIVIFYNWIWSLLTNLFYPRVGLATPWLALSMLINHANNPPKLNLLLKLTLISPFLLASAVIYGNYRYLKIKTIYGDAHWATIPEISKMKLSSNKNGLIIGDKNGYLLYAPLLSHALIFAPSRSGKGVSQIIPILLTFNGSVLAIDLKNELFTASSGFRQKFGQAVFLFSPAAQGGITHCCNPLDYIRRDRERLISDIQLIAEILISQKNDKDDFWISEARSLVIGILLWLMDSGRPFTIGELAALIKGTPNFIDFLKTTLEEDVIEGKEIEMHPVAYRNINNYIQKATKEQSGIKSTITSRLNLWDDPFINAATSRSDFDLKKMRQEKMTVYLGIPPNQLNRLAPLMNLFIQLFLTVMTESLPKLDEPHKVLVILDEFCALGRMETVKTGFGYLAGYNLHLIAAIQNIGQFYALYGRDDSEVFFQNTDYKIAYRQNTRSDQEFISHQLGTRTVKTRGKSYSSAILSKPYTNINESYIQRPLLTHDEVRIFPAKQGIAMINGQPPIRYKRIIYYQDNRFKDRVLPPINITPITPFYPTLSIKSTPKITQKELNSEQVEFAKKLIPLFTLMQQATEKNKILQPKTYEDLEIAD